MTHAMRAFTRLGDATSWGFIALVLVGAGGAASKQGLLLAGAALLATVLSQPFKRLCRRRRPSIAIDGFTALAEDPDAFSFPSGHTRAAASVAFAFAGHPELGPMLPARWRSVSALLGSTLVLTIRSTLLRGLYSEPSPEARRGSY